MTRDAQQSLDLCAWSKVRRSSAESRDWVALAGLAALPRSLAFCHRMHFLVLSSPVGLNIPGALWLGQGLEGPGADGQEIFKITQGVDTSLAVML